MKIWLDDIRPMPSPPRDGKTHYPFDINAPYDIHCGNAGDIMQLIEAGVVTFISFDHDLGIGETGYEVAKKIEELAHNGKLKPIEYKVHSANYVGAVAIRDAMESAWRAWHSRGECGSLT